jgi:multidrug resistance efflux pump
MNPRIRRILPVVLILVLVAAAGAWYFWGRGTGSASGAITASGTVEAVNVSVGPEISGRVTKVLAAMGDSVVAGQALLRLDDTLLSAQRNQAAAAKDTAQAGLNTTQAALNLVQLQYQQVLESALLADSTNRTGLWVQPQPSDFNQPGWYFSKEELIAALQAEVDTARQNLATEQNNLQSLLADPKYAGVVAAEQRLAQAQEAYLVAQDVLNRANSAVDNEQLRQAAQDQFDSAKQELEDAQQAYDDLLNTQAMQDLLDARGRVRAAQERYNTALTRLAKMHTGADSLAVQIANAGVQQAQAAVNQAQSAASQAQAQLDLIDAQIAKLTVYAPVSGVILGRNIEPGEMALAGSSALIIGQLDNLTITVYIAEDIYGQIHLGQTAQITTDSFPGETFSGSVTRIADQAEFTPRNVQTNEGRRSEVFAVEITISQPDGKLKPGMPADVVFGE